MLGPIDNSWVEVDASIVKVFFGEEKPYPDVDKNYYPTIEYDSDYITLYDMQQDHINRTWEKEAQFKLIARCLNYLSTRQGAKILYMFFGLSGDDQTEYCTLEVVVELDTGYSNGT